MTIPPSDAPFIGWEWDVVHDADLNDALPQLLFNGVAINLTGCTVNLHVRPTYAYATPIVILTGPSSSIVVDDAPTGLVSVYVPKATVDDWPIGAWQFFLRVVETSSSKVFEVARGPFRIHSGNIAP
jgi:hypothetical protein